MWVIDFIGNEGGYTTVAFLSKEAALKKVVDMKKAGIPCTVRQIKEEKEES